MLHIENLTYSYLPLKDGDPRVVALDSISLQANSGQCIAITGTNGSGKTTLCLAAAGLAPRLTEGRIDTGRILLADHDVQQEKPGSLAHIIGLVMQDPSGQLFNATIAEEIAWGLENLGIPRAEMGERIRNALDLVGLIHFDWHRSPLSLSGGEQKRLALASVLALHPRILILDEPSGGLSPTARAEMVSTLRRLRDTTDLAILLTESDPTVIAALADHLIVLDQGRIAAQGLPRGVYSTLTIPGIPTPPATRFTQVLKLQGVSIENALTITELASQLPPLPNKPAYSGATPPNMQTAPAIDLHELRYAYNPVQLVLTGITLTIPQGQFVALTGDNGAGKTTLARHLIGLVRPTSGQVHIMGKDAASQSIGQLARQVGFAFQNPELQIFNATVRDEIAFGPRSLGLPDEYIDAALTTFDLHPIAGHPPAALSFSTRRLIALASIAAMHTPILVLDEPTVGLDAAGQERVMAWLAERHKQGTTILLITHDMDLVAAYAERVIVLNNGQITADGTPHEVFTQPTILTAAGLEPPFAIQLAEALHTPALAADLTPEGAAHRWLSLNESNHA